MAILEGCLAVMAAVTATLTYKFFAFPMPPQAEETYKRRTLLLFWWILQFWVSLLITNSKNKFYFHIITVHMVIFAPLNLRMVPPPRLEFVLTRFCFKIEKYF